MTSQPSSGPSGSPGDRPVVAAVPATYAIEGGGFGVYRPFPTQALPLLDPFLLLDEMEPTHHEPGEFKGAPDHPHRGFETVTYLLAGEVEHRDSHGGHGITGPGGVQWMTAGDGVVHSEMPSRRLQTAGGTIHGFQLWVNLPRAAKRARPRYQNVDPDQLGRVEGEGWTVRVVAGSLLGARGPASTHTPVTVAHLSVSPGGVVELDADSECNVGLYAFNGSGTLGAGDHGRTGLERRTMAIYEPGQGTITVAVPISASEGLELLVLAGRPLDEPVARYGPFVMNTEAEILEAMRDYQAGRMGRIPAQT